MPFHLYHRLCTTHVHIAIEDAEEPQDPQFHMNVGTVLIPVTIFLQIAQATTIPPTPNRDLQKGGTA